MITRTKQKEKLNSEGKIKYFNDTLCSQLGEKLDEITDGIWEEYVVLFGQTYKLSLVI